MRCTSNELCYQHSPFEPITPYPINQPTYLTYSGEETGSKSGVGMGTASAATQNRERSLTAGDVLRRVTFAVMGRKPKVIENWTDEQVHPFTDIPLYAIVSCLPFSFLYIFTIASSNTLSIFLLTLSICPANTLSHYSPPLSLPPFPLDCSCFCLS